MIIIKQAKYNDIFEILEIDKRAFGEYGISKEMIKSQIKIFPEGAFVAKENGKIIGFICCERHEGEKIPPYSHDVRKTHSKKGRLFYLSVITVAENFRNKNIGSLFLGKISELGKRLGLQKIYLPVNKTHPYLEEGILNFWKKNGYKIVGETDWEVSLGKVINAYILEKLIR